MAGATSLVVQEPGASLLDEETTVVDAYKQYYTRIRLVNAKVCSRGESQRTQNKSSDVSKRPRALEKRPAPAPKATLKLEAQPLGYPGRYHHRARHRAARGFRVGCAKQALEPHFRAHLVAGRGARRPLPLWTRARCPI